MLFCTNHHPNMYNNDLYHELHKDLKETWFSYGGRTFIADNDMYIYVCNAGTSNGANGVESGDPTTPAIIQLIIEYYGMD